MKYDRFKNPIFESRDLVDVFYQDKTDVLKNIIVEDSEEMQKLEHFSGITLNKHKELDISIEDYDMLCQSEWFIPEEYKSMDIEGFLANQCPKENYQRLIEELEEFRARNMLPLLKVLKYVVDTLRSNNVLWGVGRGSSVASYVLYLLGVHRIDSVKYKLDWREFLR